MAAKKPHAAAHSAAVFLTSEEATSIHAALSFEAKNTCPTCSFPLAFLKESNIYALCSTLCTHSHDETEEEEAEE